MTQEKTPLEMTRSMVFDLVRHSSKDARLNLACAIDTYETHRIVVNMHCRELAHLLLQLGCTQAMLNETLGCVRRRLELPKVLLERLREQREAHKANMVAAYGGIFGNDDD